MDICLVNPPTSRDGESLYFPMSLLALASFVEREGFSAEIVDYDFEVRTGCFPKKNFIEEAVKDLRKRFSAPIYGITTVTSNFALALLLAEEIKRQSPRTEVILGGPQASSVPKETLARFPMVDAVIVGEGEHTLEEYLHQKKSGHRVDQIPGVLCRDNMHQPIPLKRKLETSLDSLPPIDFTKIPMKEYAVFERINVGYFLPFIEAGRGCPFDCTFCSTSVMWSRKFRVKSPERIYQELSMLNKKYGFQSFELLHDNFTTSREYLHNFCNRLIELNKEGVTWSCASRVDTLYDEDLELMERAGCDGVFFGVETGSARMQKIVRKDIDLSEYDSLLDGCRKRNFRVNVGFIMGFPEERDEDFEETLHWVVRSKLKGAAHVHVNRLAALAGTELIRRHGHELTRIFNEEGVPIEEKRVMGMIQKHRDLFSSAYLIPHPIYDDQTMEELLRFSQVTTERFYHELDWLKTRQGMKIMDVFHHWMNWKGRLASDGIETHFMRFVREEILPLIARRNLEKKTGGSSPQNVLQAHPIRSD